MEGIAHGADGREGLAEELDEGVVDALVYKNARGGGADLAHVGHDTRVRPFGRLLKVCVVKNEQWALAASFQCDVL